MNVPAYMDPVEFAREQQSAAGEFHCPHDTNNDGDCHHCAKSGTCPLRETYIREQTAKYLISEILT